MKTLILALTKVSSLLYQNIVDIVPIHKKKDKSDKINYRPVSILSNCSKVYEKLIYNQLYQYFENILFPSQCGYRKGYSTQHCLLVAVENFNKVWSLELF